MHLSLQKGDTPLMLASCNAHMECVKLLLGRGANVNMQTKVSEFCVGDIFTHTCMTGSQSNRLRNLASTARPFWVEWGHGLLG